MKYVVYGALIFCATSAMDQQALITKGSSYSFKDSLEEHTALVYQIAFNPIDSTELISNSRDYTIKIWNVSQGICKQSFNKANKGSCFALSHDGNFIAYGHKGNTLSIINKQTLSTQDIKGSQHDSINHVERISFHPKDSSCLISYLSNRSDTLKNIITLFNLKDNTHRTIKAYEMYNLAIDPIDGKNIVIGSKTSSKIYDIETQKMVHELHDTCGTQKIIFSPNTPKECLFYNVTDAYVQIYDMTNNTLIRSFPLKYKEKPILLNNIAFNFNGTQLIATASDQTHIFDAKTGNYIESLPNTGTFFGTIMKKIKKPVKNGIHTDKMLGSVSNSDGTMIATHSNDNTIKIWQK